MSALALQADATSAVVSFGDPADVQRFNLADFDAIRVSLRNGDDQFTVSGLAAETSITGSDTLDHLQVSTLGGNDKVTVDPNVSTLIGVGVDLGSARSDQPQRGQTRGCVQPVVVGVTSMYTESTLPVNAL